MSANIGPSDSIHKQQSILDKRITAIHKGVYIMRLVISKKDANEQKADLPMGDSKEYIRGNEIDIL
jgi:hypothetical protein